MVDDKESGIGFVLKEPLRKGIEALLSLSADENNISVQNLDRTYEEIIWVICSHAFLLSLGKFACALA